MREIPHSPVVDTSLHLVTLERWTWRWAGGMVILYKNLCVDGLTQSTFPEDRDGANCLPVVSFEEEYQLMRSTHLQPSRNEKVDSRTTATFEFDHPECMNPIRNRDQRGSVMFVVHRIVDGRLEEDGSSVTVQVHQRNGSKFKRMRACDQVRDHSPGLYCVDLDGGESERVSKETRFEESEPATGIGLI